MIKYSRREHQRYKILQRVCGWLTSPAQERIFMQPVQDNEAIVAHPRYEVDRKLIVPVSYFKR